jgi:integrase
VGGWSFSIRMLLYGYITTFEHYLSIMTNSAKTLSTKARKGTVSIRLDSGSIKACFPRTHFADEKQLKLATGIPNDAQWETTANKLQRRLQLELEEGKLASVDGSFNMNRYREILEEYGLRAKLRVVKSVSTSDGQLPPKPELSILQVWANYLEYIEPGMKQSHYVNMYCNHYSNFIKSAIEATESEDAIKIRNWLVSNRALDRVKILLSNLSKAYQLGMKNKSVTHDPYNGLSEEIKILGAKRKKQNEVNADNTDTDVFDKTKAYTWDEVQEILKAFREESKRQYAYNFIKFKFLTGTRTGEAIAFMWGDVMWEKERILIKRTYDRVTAGFYPTKSSKGDKELIRIFPMPVDGELWNLLKSIPEGESNEIVFKSKHGQIIRGNNFITNQWQPIINQLIGQGKLTKYLPPYNTRHTFITHQIFDLGRDEKIVSAWCGHGEFISQKHYQDTAKYAMQINPELPANDLSSQKSEIDLLKEQIEQMKATIEQLTNK